MKLLQLLTSPARWTKGAFARDGRGKGVPHDDPKACRFCVLGALRRCYVLGSPKFCAARNKLDGAVPNKNVINFNDDPKTTFKDIVRIIKKAKV